MNRQNDVMINAIRAYELANPYDYEQTEQHCCSECGKSLDNTEYDICNTCWHFENIGEVKWQVLLWLQQGFSVDKIMDILTNDDWFPNMTVASYNRWGRALQKIAQKKAALAKKAA